MHFECSLTATLGKKVMMQAFLLNDIRKGKVLNFMANTSTASRNTIDNVNQELKVL